MNKKKVKKWSSIFCNGIYWSLDSKEKIAVKCPRRKARKLQNKEETKEKIKNQYEDINLQSTPNLIPNKQKLIMDTKNVNKLSNINNQNNKISNQQTSNSQTSNQNTSSNIKETINEDIILLDNLNDFNNNNDDDDETYGFQDLDNY